MSDVHPQSKVRQAGPPSIVTAAIVWHAVLVVLSILVALSIFQMDKFPNKNDDLGNAVQGFVGFVALLPAVIAVWGSILMLRRHSLGRMLALALNYVMFVLGIFYLLHLWGFFVGFDDIANALHENRTWLIGFAFAYLAFRLAGRIPEKSPWRGPIEMAAVGFSMLTVIVLLWTGDAVKGVEHILKTYAEPRTILTTFAILVSALIAYSLLKLGRYFGETPEQRVAWQGWLMLSPNIIGFAIFFAGPLLLSFYISFTKSVPGSTPDFVGLSNYRNILSIEFKIQSDLRDVNTSVVLRDPNGNELAANDDAEGNPALSRIEEFTLPATGLYTVQAQAGETGRTTGPYSLAIAQVSAGAGEVPPPEKLPLEYGKTVTGELKNQAGADWQFYGTAGDVVTITMRGKVYPSSVLDSGYNELDHFTVGSKRLVIGARETLFWQSLRNTLLFCLLLVPLSIIPALALAILLNSKIPGMHFFRAVYFLPSVAAVVGTAMIWRQLYDSRGFINFGLAEITQFINSLLGTSIADPEIRWLTNPSLILFSVVLLATWQAIGFNTVLFLAGLQGVPRELYEAAYVDGANRWKQFLNVTLPLLAPTTFFVIVTTIITGLQVFAEPYALLSETDPIPIEGTTSVYYLYRKSFKSFEFGYGSSVAWIIFALIFAVTLIQFRFTRAKAYED